MPEQVRNSQPPKIVIEKPQEQPSSAPEPSPDGSSANVDPWLDPKAAAKSIIQSILANIQNDVDIRETHKGVSQLVASTGKDFSVEQRREFKMELRRQMNSTKSYLESLSSTTFVATSNF